MPTRTLAISLGNKGPFVIGVKGIDPDPAYQKSKMVH